MEVSRFVLIWSNYPAGTEENHENISQSSRYPGLNLNKASVNKDKKHCSLGRLAHSQFLLSHTQQWQAYTSRFFYKVAIKQYFTHLNGRNIHFGWWRQQHYMYSMFRISLLSSLIVAASFSVSFIFSHNLFSASQNTTNRLVFLSYCFDYIIPYADTAKYTLMYVLAIIGQQSGNVTQCGITRYNDYVTWITAW